MVCIRKATIEDLLAIQAFNRSENYQINYDFCYHILSWLQFLYVAEDYGGKIVGYLLMEEETPECHGHITSISVLYTHRKLGLATKLVAAAQNAIEQVSIVAKKRPTFGYANPRMRADVRDWLVELVQMELSVPDNLKLELMAPVGCFLTRFVRTAQGVNEMVPSMLKNVDSKKGCSNLNNGDGTGGLVHMVPSMSKFVDSKKECSNLNNGAGAGCNVVCKREVTGTIREKNIILVFDNYYYSLRAAEAKKRIKPDYMDKVQDYAKIYMRAVTIDWLVKVAEFFELWHNTLYLAIYYMDRYLCGTTLGRQKFQLLGATCILIASKYDAIQTNPLWMEDLCIVTDKKYSVDELLQMESSVLNFLEFELKAPTAVCYLPRFVLAAQDVNKKENPLLECLASYICEFSLIEYSMLCYPPSLVAASAVFFARYLLFPSRKPPWNLALRRYTRYQPSDLVECVKALHVLVTESPNSIFPAIREKYSKRKHFCVAKKYRCPPAIPMEHFQNINSSSI